MTSTLAVPTTSRSTEVAEKPESGLDVDWLINKKDTTPSLRRTRSATANSSAQSTPQRARSESQIDATQAGQNSANTHSDVALDPLERPAFATAQSQSNGAGGASAVPVINEPNDSKAVSQSTAPPVTPTKSTPKDDNQKHSRISLKDKGRRPSWFSSLGSKLSGHSEKPASRNNSLSALTSKAKSPQASPAFENSNPFDPSQKSARDVEVEQKPVPQGPRRPSVLVAAGTETKLDNSPGIFGALRRLSSGNTATLGKSGGANGALAPRKVLNLDQNRQRPRIADFDQNKLRRVAFKVDVEIAGIAAQADEQNDQDRTAKAASPAVKSKDRAEGTVLKKSASVDAKPDPATLPTSNAQAEAQEDQKKEEIKDQVQKEQESTATKPETTNAAEIGENSTLEAPKPTMTRKKEKKKRSEAERKERKQKKRRQAEENGLIPLELTMEGDSDSSGGTQSGAATPRKGQPTTDPLRIYKRCCQLRETQALATVKDQISKPSATLAEAPGTVATMDLSGAELSLADIQTLGDWLAVVPVRRLILDDCKLTDEGIRIILSGLSGCKNQEQIRANRKLPRRGSGKSGIERMGVIERLSLKNNTAVSAIGWKHIALFIHLCQSLRAIDLTGIPFPSSLGADLSRTSTTNSSSLSSSQELPARRIELSSLFAQALGDRYGNALEELILSSCALSTSSICEIIDSVIKCKVKRLGLANNDLDEASLKHIVRYITSNICEGLDLGGNDLGGKSHVLTEALDAENPIFAVSLADCELTVEDLRCSLQNISLLRNFKFIDLSRNHGLFKDTKEGVSLLRRKLPQLKELKRIHLADVDMSPNQLISLVEIFPDCPALAHVSILGNQQLVQCMNSNQPEAQEEACAVFVSLMTAVRASKSLVAVEIEVPSQESSEVVKALASQVVAYSLRNLERTTLSDFGVSDQANGEKTEKHAPEVLLHLVGHMEGYADNADNDEPAPDEDYVIASTGIVKALGVCLGNKEASRMASRNISPSASGTATPRSNNLKSTGHKKPKDVSMELCESARKIRRRLRRAMIKEDQAGDLEAYRRLMYLDQTLERTIKRFEDEYPESRPKESPSMLSIDSGNSSAEVPGGPLERLASLDDRQNVQSEADADTEPYALRLSRTNSNTSLARALTEEEGRMHRFGQHMRREVLKPTGTDDHLHGTSIDDEPEEASLAALRTKLEALSGSHIRDEVQKYGPDHVIKEMDISIGQLRALQQEDPEDFEQFKTSQLAAQLNAGINAKSTAESVTQDADGGRSQQS